MNHWKDEEVKSLFLDVECCKEKNNSLKYAFSAHARKFKRKTNSVRNYYYHEVDALKEDGSRCERLGLDLKFHEKSKIQPFSKEEEDELMTKVKQMVDAGQSVRNACYRLSGGDMTKMTRIQNKYQNLQKTQKKDMPANVITFKQRQKLLTDNDINSLFFGLVKLIKKTAADEATEKLREEKNSLTSLLHGAMDEIAKKNKEIVLLKEKNILLSKKISETTASKQDKLKEKLESKSLGIRAIK